MHHFNDISCLVLVSLFVCLFVCLFFFWYLETERVLDYLLVLGFDFYPFLPKLVYLVI